MAIRQRKIEAKRLAREQRQRELIALARAGTPVKRGPPRKPNRKRRAFRVGDEATSDAS
jgi:hypothetical protein